MASVGRFKVWKTLICSLFELLRELTMTEVAGTHMVLSNPVLEFESITQVKKIHVFFCDSSPNIKDFQVFFYRVFFFNWSALKTTKCQTLRKF